MSVALPPPITPQQASPMELRAAAQAQHEWLFDYGKFRIHVFGFQSVDQDKMRQIIAATGSLSDAVRAIGYVYYVSGYPAAYLQYAAIGSDIYVRAMPGTIKAVVGPPSLLAYFSSLKGKTPLTASELEPDRALADGYTERGGESFKPTFKTLDDGAVELDLGEASPGRQTTDVAGSFSNYGNRYAGPYLANAGLRQSFSSGDEITLTGVTSTRFLGLGGSHSEPYHEGDAGLSRVTSFGVFSLNGQYADFQLSSPGETLTGKLESGSASWLYPLYSDLQQRLNIQGRFIHDHDDIHATEYVETTSVVGDIGSALNGFLSPLGLQLPLSTIGLANGEAEVSGEVFSEQYNSLELALSYVARFQHGDHLSELQAGLLVRKGAGQNRGVLTTADLGYLLWQPSFSARYGFSQHWTALAQGSVQFSNDTLPLQQQWVIGGPTSLHAYRSGAGVGDHGGGALLGMEWKGYLDSWTERYGIRPRGFVEYGSATLKHADVISGQPGGVEAADVGAAVDMHYGSWLSGSLSVAQSIFGKGKEHSPDGLEKNYVFFQLAAKY